MSKNIPLAFFWGISKAFNTIDNRILLQKLQVYGIRGCALKWFCSYLSDRSQCVCIDDICSTFLQIKCGIPQGSILGPLLFNIYINDIVKTSHLFQFIFADDTNLFASHSNLDELLKIVNQESAKISNWLKINKLSLNVEKPHYIIFHNRHKKIPLGSKIGRAHV